MPPLILCYVYVLNINVSKWIKTLYFILLKIINEESNVINLYKTYVNIYEME